MKPNEQILEEFYSGFAAANSDTMNSCYHPEVVFQDPVFGTLESKDVRDMWEMLIAKSNGKLIIKFSNVVSNGTTGSVDWVANYTFSTTNRHVRNVVHAQFEFKDGLIIRHTDTFDLYHWSKQALGIKGTLLGWTPFFKRKIQQTALQSLRAFQRKKEKELN
ncbi:nuclear transport factor 2 family protein [Flavobacterium sp. SM2513]|uniref:nuclear transport factor 2 family protein n=1 Tax=Flavobacterium sp. SM2513 TaxID=3424766 RepID=UPI003D7F43F0